MSRFFHLAQELEHLRALLDGASREVGKVEAEVYSAKQKLLCAKAQEIEIHQRLTGTVRQLREISPEQPCFCAGCFTDQRGVLKRGRISEEACPLDLTVKKQRYLGTSRIHMSGNTVQINSEMSTTEIAAPVNFKCPREYFI